MTATSPIAWVCPACGSDTIRVFYTERRACRVGTFGEETIAIGKPWPSYEADEFIDIDPDTFSFACDACGEDEIEPRALT